jgi:hypothetical protein
MISKALLALSAFLVLVAVTEVSAAGGADGAARLHAALEKGYDKLVYPDNITLEIGIGYVCAYMDEGHYRLSSRVVERYHWVDNRLKWDPKKYENVDKISVPDEMIWTPDVHLQNAIMAENRASVHAVVLPTGDVYWIPPVNYNTRCGDHEADEYDYHCKLVLGSWTYDANSIPLELFRGGFDTKMYLDTCPYTLENAKAVIKNTFYECCKNPFATLNVEFDIHKKKAKKDDDDDDDDSDSDSDSDSDDDDDHHGYKARHSYECPWPHCTLDD